MSSRPATVHILLELVADLNFDQQQEWWSDDPEKWPEHDERNYLLSQMYPEGSPAHPAWPSGHATVAGACVTVIKAIYDDTQPIKDPYAPPPASGKDSPYKVDGVTLTVGGELDKLATNITLGRNFGGVHFRADGEHGILLGEAVAIRYLQDHLREYREEFRTCCDGRHPAAERQFVLTKRNGQRICITADNVTPVDEDACVGGAYAKQYAKQYDKLDALAQNLGCTPTKQDVDAALIAGAAEAQAEYDKQTGGGTKPGHLQLRARTYLKSAL